MEITVNYKDGTSSAISVDSGLAVARRFFKDALDEAAKRCARQYTQATGNDWFSEEYEQHIASNQSQYQAESLRLKGEVIDLICNLPQQIADAEMDKVLSQIKQLVASMPMSHKNIAHAEEMAEALKKHVRKEQWYLYFSGNLFLEQGKNGEVL